ncbi:MAG: hypothetical protein KF830_03335 [Planctomycetes bacterium]|nr:hypothetical protein [Planctomycetota bacterium]
MNARLQRLRAEVRSDLDAFLCRVDELARLSFAGAGEAVLAQAAVALHHGYGAIEAALTRVARHFFRHAYATAWDAQRLLGLRDEVVALRPAVERDFTALDSLLAQLAAAESD